MRVGLPSELLSVAWMPELKEAISRIMPGIVWVHAAQGKAPRPLFLEGDVCYPLKTMVGSCLALLAEADTLLLPRIVGLDGFLMCPNFRGLPDIVALNARTIGLPAATAIVSVVMEVADDRHIKILAETAAQGLREQCGPGNTTVCSDGNTCTATPPAADAGMARDRDISRSIALIGHPYLLADGRLNNGIPDLLRASGVDGILCTDLPFAVLDLLAREYDYYAKKLYFRSAREALGAFLYFTRVRQPAGIIHLVPFNCGVDALLRIEIESLHKKMPHAPPYMVIVCDEHTQHDHVVTRIEAFLDIVNEHRKI